MQGVATRLEGPILVRPTIHGDERGFFHESYRRSVYTELGIPEEFVQDNHSRSGQGIVRGMHFQVGDGMAKLVRCARGAILDVVVDLRVGSPGYGRWEAVRLDDENRRSLFVSEGLGHAFMALSEMATTVYLCSTPYTPDREHGVDPLDPALGIAWPAGMEPVLSDKDAQAPSLAEAHGAGLLPRYSDCLAHVADLRAHDRRVPS